MVQTEKRKKGSGVPVPVFSSFNDFVLHLFISPCVHYKKVIQSKGEIWLMWKTLYIFIKKGVLIMNAFIVSVRKTLQCNSSSFSISPSTDYGRHVPQSAEQLMTDNWRKTGDSLYSAMYKVGEDIESRYEE